MGNDCSEESQTKPSLKDMYNKLQKYAQSQKLMLYQEHIRQTIENLFVLDQVHIADQLLRLLEQKQGKDVRMMQDLSRIDLEMFDKMCHTPQPPPHPLPTTLLIPPPHTSPSTTKTGKQCLKSLPIMLILPCQCFGTQNKPSPLSSTDLPSGVTYLELFFEKLDNLLDMYLGEIGLYLVCPQEIREKYMEAVGKWGRAGKVRVVGFMGFANCFFGDGKMVLDGDYLLFNKNQGDFLQFLLKQLSNQYQKYDYISICDIYNYVGNGIPDLDIFGALHQDDTKAIAATLRNNGKGNGDGRGKGKGKGRSQGMGLGKGQEMRVEVVNNFVLDQGLEFSDILIKVKMLKAFQSEDTSLNRILNSRIQRKPHIRSPTPQSAPIYYFSRLPQHLLYTPMSLLRQVPTYITTRTEYSDMCKQKLCIVNDNTQEIIEICPTVLNNQGELEKIREFLMGGQVQAFPIVVVLNEGDCGNGDQSSCGNGD